MDILHVPNFYNPGGSAKACYEIACNLSEHNQQFVGCVNGSYRYKFMDLGQSHLFNTVGPFDYGDRIHELITYFKPDVMHVYIPGHESPSYFEGLPENLVKVCTVLCGQEIGFDQSIFDHITFISEYNKSLSLSKIEEVNSSVIRCGSTCPIEYNYEPIENSNIVFGRVTAFCPSKRIMDTLQCALKLRNNPFLIGGEVQDKSYYTKILNFINDNKLDNVEIYLNMSDKMRENLYERIDVLHYPTTNEAFCFSILEGMERGLPVISYDNSAIPELNHKDNLILVEDGNIDQLVNETVNLSESKDDCNKLGKLNRSVYEEFYTSQRYSSDVLDLYERLHSDR